MSTERRLAEAIVTHLSEAQIKGTENNPKNPRPGLGKQFDALKSYLEIFSTDDHFAQRIIIEALMRRILGPDYEEGLRVQRLADLHQIIDSATPLPAREPTKPPLFAEPTRLLPEVEYISPPIFNTLKRKK